MYNSQFSILTSYIDYHIVLSINLALIASLSIIVADHLTRTPIYPHNSTSYPTILCLSIHHAWLSGFLIIGSGAHASIFNLRELQPDIEMLDKKIIRITQELGTADFITAKVILVSTLLPSMVG